MGYSNSVVAGDPLDQSCQPVTTFRIFKAFDAAPINFITIRRKGSLNSRSRTFQDSLPVIRKKYGTESFV